ncbi:MAG: hypothetical protein SF069_19205 [Phycisphaerae bacterium]|nr:hypothetical protein [Phycisphaerae bacterium]
MLLAAGVVCGAMLVLSVKLPDTTPALASLTVFFFAPLAIARTFHLCPHRLWLTIYGFTFGVGAAVVLTPFVHPSAFFGPVPTVLASIVGVIGFAGALSTLLASELADAFLGPKRPPPAGACPWCFYDRQGVSSDRCSECGRNDQEDAYVRRIRDRNHWIRSVVGAILLLAALFCFWAKLPSLLVLLAKTTPPRVLNGFLSREFADFAVGLNPWDAQNAQARRALDPTTPAPLAAQFASPSTYEIPLRFPPLFGHIVAGDAAREIPIGLTDTARSILTQIAATHADHRVRSAAFETLQRFAARSADAR